HDIGKVVLDHHVCRVAPEFYRVLRDEQSLLAAEAKVIGITHPEAGEKLALEWELAEPLVQAVRWHHEPRKATEHGDLCTLVCLSDWLSRILWEGQQPWMAQEMELTTLLARFGMSPNALPTLLSALPLREIHRQVMLS
ncbi:MAG: HDOD domain-containing protein, partial [Candidatus Cloacimonetes bacterium]|nr:HDOD domain-containing protein [Candidatus Cloacimonadota bacterium]